MSYGGPSEDVPPGGERIDSGERHNWLAIGVKWLWALFTGWLDRIFGRSPVEYDEHGHPYEDT